QRLQEMSPALRRTISRFSVGRATEENRPVERLWQAGIEIVEWRDFRAAWQRRAFSRDEEMQQLIGEVAALAEIASGCRDMRHPLRQHLQPAVDFMARLRRSEEIGRRDMDESEALLIRLSRQLNKRRGTKGSAKFSASHSRDEAAGRTDRLAE